MKKATPVTIELIQNQNTNVQFCPDFLVLYGLKGKTTIVSGKKQVEIKTGGILVVNPFTHYSLDCSQESGVAVLHIPQEMLQITGINKQLAHISCHIANDSSGVHREYDQIRMYFARIFKTYFQNSPQDHLQLITYTSQLLSVFAAHFVSSESPSNHLQSNSAVFERCDRIMTYIHEHWREPISIDQLAQQEYISPGYLSRFFKEHVGTTFTEYLMELRLQNAARDLENNRDTVTEIAFANGFKNVNSFIEHFKVRYGSTPKQYQKLAEKRRHTLWLMQLNEPEDDGVSNLLEYATIDEQASMLAPLPPENRQVSICTSMDGQALRHTWRKLLNIGYARDGLLAEIQNQIRQAQQEIGFEYLRFHGILDDDMHIYHEDHAHQPYLDFSRVDLLLDFVLSVGLKPYIELSFMPKLLAKKETKTYDRASYFSMFRDAEKWKFLIRGLLQHCVERYGRSRVIEWKFTTIGSNSFALGVIEQEEYLSLYKTTYECVKAVDRRLMFGGPGGLSSSIWDSRCIHDFFEFAIAENCVPDFICTQNYPHRAIEQDAEFWQFTISQTSAPSVLSSDEHYTQTMLRDYRKLLESYGLSHLKIWMEEWNSTLWQRDLSSDTCYKAAWLTKNICENYDDVESFGYWTLSDFIEERSDFGNVYHGGYGLFTYNGIPKGGWCAMQLLHMLGDTKLDSGDGWLVTKSKNGIQIILNHYCHYDNLYCLRYQKLTDPLRAYSVFVERGFLNFSVRLTDLPAGRYEVHRFSITPEHGSSFDAWLNMGMPHYLRAEEIDYLKRASQPMYHIETLELQGDYTVESQLQPHEVQIILLTADDTI